MIDANAPKLCKPEDILKYTTIFNENFENTRKLKTSLFGLNQIVIEVPSILMVFLTEMFSPFYIFQVASIILWYTDQYGIYATSILIMTSVSIVLTIQQIRENSRSLKRMIEKGGKPVQKLINKNDRFEWEVCNDFELVEGDIVNIEVDLDPKASVLTCDMVLLEGGVIVDESMLTGESIPVTKVAILDSGTVFSKNTDRLTNRFISIYANFFHQIPQTFKRKLVFREFFKSF